MSSHHFVKEGQEPALFILEAISFHLIEPLLEWVPLIIVSDSAVEEVLQWGIKIDVVLQHTQPLDKLEGLVKDQFPLQILPCEKDNMIIQGLEFLGQDLFTAVNIIGNRADEIVKSVEEWGSSLQVGIYSENEKWSYVTSGRFEKWMPAGATVLIKHSLASSLQTENIIKEKENWRISSGGIMKVQSTDPFWIGEPF